MRLERVLRGMKTKLELIKSESNKQVKKKKTKKATI